MYSVPHEATPSHVGYRGRIMIGRMQKMLVEVQGRALAEIRVLFKVRTLAVLLDTCHSIRVARHAWPSRKQRFEPGARF